jgi:hypothetical protein
MTYAGGAAYDTNNNGKTDNNESTDCRTMAGRATAPFIVDQHCIQEQGATARALRRSAIRKTSTTASGRSAYASCRGGKSASVDRNRLSEVAAPNFGQDGAVSALPWLSSPSPIPRVSAEKPQAGDDERTCWSAASWCWWQGCGLARVGNTPRPSSEISCSAGGVSAARSSQRL